MYRKVLLECRKIINQTVESNFTEKTDLLIKTLSIPEHNMTALYSVIAQANYMINSRRNKLSDEELRYMLRYHLLLDIDQLKRYGPLSCSMIGEETNVYKYHDYIGSLLETKFQVEYYNNGYWDGKPVKVAGDMVKLVRYGGLSDKIPYIYEESQNKNIIIKNTIDKNYILNKMSKAKKGDILVLYDNRLRNKQNKILDLCIESAKDLGYKEIWVKTLDLYTYLWKCKRVV